MAAEVMADRQADVVSLVRSVGQPDLADEITDELAGERIRTCDVAQAAIDHAERRQRVRCGLVIVYRQVALGGDHVEQVGRWRWWIARLDDRELLVREPGRLD